MLGIFTGMDLFMFGYVQRIQVSSIYRMYQMYLGIQTDRSEPTV